MDPLEENLRALEFEIPAELSARLEESSRPEPAYSYLFFERWMQGLVRGGMTVRAEPRGDRPR